MVKSLDEISKQVQEIVVSYKKEIENMWVRIDNEICTPPLINIIYPLNIPINPCIPKKILEHDANKRMRYVIRTRNRIVRQELKSFIKEVQELVPCITLEGLLGLTKIIIWGEENKLQYFKDKIITYCDYCNKP